MDTWVYPATAPGSWASAAGTVSALGSATRWNAGRLEEIQERAASIARLPWESPAGALFHSYLLERCRELDLVIEPLQIAAHELDEYGRSVRDADMLSRFPGPS